MSAPDASEIRRVLQVYDQTSTMGTRQAVGALQGITKQIAKDPAAYDLLADSGICVVTPARCLGVVVGRAAVEHQPGRIVDW